MEHGTAKTCEAEVMEEINNRCGRELFERGKSIVAHAGHHVQVNEVGSHLSDDFGPNLLVGGVKMILQVPRNFSDQGLASVRVDWIDTRPE